MQLPLVTRAPVTARNDARASLESRLSHIHRRRRRVLVRRLVTAGCWSAGILGVTAFALAAAIGAAPR
jgi:hypothetical protein